MTESEFLERFDAHIVEMRTQNAEIREEMRLSRAQHADLRAFTRDLTRRNEIVLGRMVTELKQLQAETAESLAQSRETTAQTRAHTQALLKVLDRLN